MLPHHRHGHRHVLLLLILLLLLMKLLLLLLLLLLPSTIPPSHTRLTVLSIAGPGALAHLDADAGMAWIAACKMAVFVAAVGLVAAAIGDEFEVAHFWGWRRWLASGFLAERWIAWICCGGAGGISSSSSSSSSPSDGESWRGLDDGWSLVDADIWTW